MFEFHRASLTSGQKGVSTSVLVTLAFLFAGLFQPAFASENPETLYKVKIERGQFRTASGATRNYYIYTPEATGNLPKGPFPFVVLIHGFLMTGHQQSNNAEYCAERGFIAMTPDLSKILLGDENRMANVRDILDQIKWVTNDKESPAHGIVDANRVGVAGNSSGGAVCLELVIEAQNAKVPIATMCSLDGVPWDRSFSRISDIQPLHLLSLRAEPGLCNYHAKIVSYLDELKFSYDDVKINGARHCDVENPTTMGCRCICGSSDAKYRHIFQDLTYRYFRDTLNAPVFEPTKIGFSQAVQDLLNDGKVVANLRQTENEPKQVAIKQSENSDSSTTPR
jgi:hypothetical protein